MNKEMLAKAIADRCTLKGSFTLRSGVISDLYFDKYRFESDPVLLEAVAEHLVPKLPPHIQVLAGLEMGGIPIAVTLAQKTGLPCLFVRKKAKDYGTCNLAEGCAFEGKRLLLVEDVVTSGGQVVESTALLREQGAIIEDVVCAIDREAGGTQNLKKIGLTLHPLFTRSELEG